MKPQIGNDMIAYHASKKSKWIEGLAGFGLLLLVAGILVLIS
jgi:hypothetical protein